MKKQLYLAVKRPGMTAYAQHGLPKLMTEAEFLALEDVQRVINNAKRFGDKVRLMEDDPNPNNPNIFVRDLV